MRRNDLIAVALFVAFAPGCIDGGDGASEPTLSGDWELARKEGVANPRPSDTVFTFTEEVFVIGVAVAEGGYLHSAFLPYTIDASQAPARLDYEGTYDIPGQIGIIEFVDDNTLDWKTTAPERARPTDFAPNEPDCTLYQLRKIR